jgi:hypothetical protein
MYYGDGNKVEVGDICCTDFPSLVTIGIVKELDYETPKIKILDFLGIFHYTSLEKMIRIPDFKAVDLKLILRKKDVQSIFDKFFKKEFTPPVENIKQEYIDVWTKKSK